MGRAMGKVRFIQDNKMAWFIYDGTMDKAYAKLFDNYKDFYKIAWENDEGYKDSDKCICDGDEEIEIYESYGGGMLWKGRACRRCMVITKNLDSNEYTDTLKDEEFDKWFENKKFPEWCEKRFALDS